MTSSVISKSKVTREKRMIKPVSSGGRQEVMQTESAPLLMEYWFVFVATVLAAMLFFAQIEIVNSLVQTAQEVDDGIMNAARQVGELLSSEFISNLRRFLPPLPVLPKIPF